MGYPNLRVVFTRALKTGVEHLYTCTRTPPVYSFERGCSLGTYEQFKTLLGSITTLMMSILIFF